MVEYWKKKRNLFLIACVKQRETKKKRRVIKKLSHSLYLIPWRKFTCTVCVTYRGEKMKTTAPRDLIILFFITAGESLGWTHSVKRKTSLSSVHCKYTSCWLLTYLILNKTNCVWERDYPWLHTWYSSMCASSICRAIYYGTARWHFGLFFLFLFMGNT